MKPHPSLLQAKAGRRRGFTVLELVAVLTIVAILGALALENVLNRIKRASRDSEATTLASMASVITNRIVRTRGIPSMAYLPQALADEMAQPLAAMTRTSSGNLRLFLDDPALRIGTNTTQVLPYTQSVLGSVQPLSPRILIVSSLAHPLPTISRDAATFEALWNLAPNTKPAGWSSDWDLFLEDLKIQRIDLRGLFHRIRLTNLDPFRMAPYSVERTNSYVSLGYNAFREFWLIDSSALNLHFTATNIQGRELVHEDSSYVFENGRWGRYVNYGNRSSTGQFGKLVDMFLAAPPPTDPKFGAHQQAVIDEFFIYLWYYGLWALDGWPTHEAQSTEQVPGTAMLEDCQKRLEITAYNLIN